jgi:hypothetical protein
MEDPSIDCGAGGGAHPLCTERDHHETSPESPGVTTPKVRANRYSFEFTPQDAISIYRSLARDNNPLADSFREAYNGQTFLDELIDAEDRATK